MAAHPGTIVPIETDPLPQVFIARTHVRLGEPSPEKLAAFLDALKAAGIDDLSNMLSPMPNSGLLMSFQMLGMGTAADLDEAIWEKAGADAIANAHAEAQALASAAGRSLGPAEQVTYLARTYLRGEASVSVAVRYGFLPAKP
jgi:hypothetical protein